MRGGSLKKILTCFLKLFLLSFIKIIESPYETEKPKPRSPPADKKNTVSTFECGLIISGTCVLGIFDGTFDDSIY